MQISLNARAKILALSPEGPFRIQATGSMLQGFHIDLVSNAREAEMDVTICDVPLVITDLNSLAQLSNQSLDFDYKSEEFVIRNAHESFCL